MTTTIIRKEEIESLIKLHESMKNSYFWNPPACASSRRSYEDRHSVKIEGMISNREISLECHTSCSCRNIYYKGIFVIDGKKVTIRQVKKLLD